MDVVLWGLSYQVLGFWVVQTWEEVLSHGWEKQVEDHQDPYQISEVWGEVSKLVENSLDRLYFEHKQEHFENSAENEVLASHEVDAIAGHPADREENEDGPRDNEKVCEYELWEELFVA